MQAADFLQDEALLGNVVRALSQVFVPEPTAKKRHSLASPCYRRLPEMSYLPSGKQRARACKVCTTKVCIPQASTAAATAAVCACTMVATGSCLWSPRAGLLSITGPTIYLG